MGMPRTFINLLKQLLYRLFITLNFSLDLNSGIESARALQVASQADKSPTYSSTSGVSNPTFQAVASCTFLSKVSVR